MLSKTLQNRAARRRRIRARVRGTAERPRMSVYRSLRNMYVQLIDDDLGRTLVAGSLPVRPVRPAQPGGQRSGGKEAKGALSVEGAGKLGALISKKAKAKKIGKVVFDRNAYRYHGRVKALADAAREGGLRF